MAQQPGPSVSLSESTESTKEHLTTGRTALWGSRSAVSLRPQSCVWKELRNVLQVDSKDLVGPRTEAARLLMEAPRLGGTEEEGDQTKEGDWRPEQPVSMMEVNLWRGVQRDTGSQTAAAVPEESSGTAQLQWGSLSPLGGRGPVPRWPDGTAEVVDGDDGDASSPLRLGAAGRSASSGDEAPGQAAPPPGRRWQHCR